MDEQEVFLVFFGYIIIIVMNMVHNSQGRNFFTAFVLFALFFVFSIGSVVNAQEEPQEEIQQEETQEKTQAEIDFDQEMEEIQAQEVDNESPTYNYESPAGGIQISPTKFIWTLNEGESKSSRINVKNYSDQEQVVEVEVEDFFIGQDGSKPNFYVPDENHELKARDIIHWITPPDDFVLAPGEAKWVDLSVSVPTGQPTNGYYGGVLFKTGGGNMDDIEDENAKIGISYRVGGLVILAVQGDEPMRITGELKDFFAQKNIFWEVPAILEATIVNTGNIHYPMFGNINVNKFGKKFHVIELRPQLIYPDIERTYREKMMFDWWDFGKYTADLSMWSEDKSVQLEDQTTFWIIPWKGLVILGTGIVVIMIFIWLFKKYVHLGSKPKKGKKIKK